MSAEITITLAVPAGYSKGDYARLCGNGGSGEIDYDNPLTEEIVELFPNGAGIYGWYHTPWYQFSWNHGHAVNCPGWYHQSWNKFPWYYGTAQIEVEYTVEACGEYKFALKAFDSLGNPHTGDPEEESLSIHIAPAAPVGLKKISYDKATDILILDTAA